MWPPCECAPSSSIPLKEELYPRLLGNAWHQLAEPIRRLHNIEKQKQGYFTIIHGNSWISRFVARLCRLPGSASEAITYLKIVPVNGGQHWERQFGSATFITTQSSNKGHLVERYGPLEFYFALRVVDGALCYKQVKVRLSFGCWGFPILGGPFITGGETAQGEAKVNVSVQIKLPFIGLLMRYEGNVLLEEPTL